MDFIRDTGGATVWLDCPPEVLRLRCAGIDNRPLFRDAESFTRLLTERLPFYRLADFQVPVDELKPAEVVEQILRLRVY